jgi:parallel beta-helix repeat protein
MKTEVINAGSTDPTAQNAGGAFQLNLLRRVLRVAMLFASLGMASTGYGMFLNGVYVADTETTTTGSGCGGGIADTRTIGGAVECGSEAGTPKRLIRFWTIASVPSGSYTLKVIAKRNQSNGDTFTFSWGLTSPGTTAFSPTAALINSTSNQTFTNLVTLNSTSSVYVRILDSITSSDNTANSLSIDYIALIPIPPTLTITGPASVTVGGTGQYIANVNGTPLASGDPKVWWVIPETSIASIGSTSGVATGIAAGSATVRFDYLWNGTWWSSWGTMPSKSISVVAAGPPTLTITGPASITVGGTGQYIANVNGAPLPSGDPNVWWVIPETSIASIGATTGIATGLASGSATVRFDYFWNGTWWSSWGTMPSYPITVVAAGYGPTPSITKPPGSIDILFGSSIQTAIDNNPPGSTFWIKSGTRSITSSIVPKTGQSFVGEYGAILDGSTWSTTDSTAGAFQGHNADIDNVTIKNLYIRNMPQKGIHAYVDWTDNWTIENCEITGCTHGVLVSHGSTVRNCRIHDNISNTPDDPDVSKQGGGYGISMTRQKPATIVTFDHNEICHNGREQKSIDGGIIHWLNNYVHDNRGVGIWCDGDNAGTIIENNTVDNNGWGGAWGAAGIMWEGSRNGIIRNNIIRWNSDMGIFVSSSKDTEIYGNYLEDNKVGISYFIDCNNILKFEWQDDLANVYSHDNTIKVLAPWPGDDLGGHFSWTGFGTTNNPPYCAMSNLAPYAGVNNSKNNRFDYNTYYSTDTNGWFNYWDSGSGSALKTWTEWKALGHDAHSTLLQY